MILTKENYHSLEANKEYYSVSQIKSFMDCEARTMAELSGEYVRDNSTSLLVGSYVDAHFSRELDLFRAQHPEIYTRGGELKSEYRKAEDIIARIERDELAMRLLDGERQAIVTGYIADLPFKAKLDVWLPSDKTDAIARDFPLMDDLLFAPGAIIDMKIMRDFEPLYREGEGRLNFVEYWKYDLQMAVYQEIVKQQKGEKPLEGGRSPTRREDTTVPQRRTHDAATGGGVSEIPCYILAATKEPVTDIGLFKLPQELMDVAMELMMDKLERIREVKLGLVMPERCGKCDYCKMMKVLDRATWLEDWA